MNIHTVGFDRGELRWEILQHLVGGFCAEIHGVRSDIGNGQMLLIQQGILIRVRIKHCHITGKTEQILPIVSADAFKTGDLLLILLPGIGAAEQDVSIVKQQRGNTFSAVLIDPPL